MERERCECRFKKEKNEVILKNMVRKDRYKFQIVFSRESGLRKRLEIPIQVVPC